MPNDRTSGDWMVEVGVWLVGAIKNVVLAVVFVVFAFAIVLPDLMLGPQFLIAYSDQQGVALGPISYPVPWLLSLATTGFQYLVYHRIRAGGLRGASKHDRWAVIVAACLFVVDTATDVGGMTSLLAGPAQGMNIVPDDPNALWVFLAVLTVGFCGLHEVIIAPLLVMGHGVRDQQTGTPLSFLVEGAIWMLGFLFGALRGAFIVGTVVGVFGLDLVLGPQFIFAFLENSQFELNRFLALVPWILSIVMTGAQALIYRRIKQGGFEGPAKLALYLGLGLAVVDTLVDVAGFTAFMYGPAVGTRVIPPDPPVAWFLLALLVVLLCGFWEWLMEGLVSRPSRGLGGGPSNRAFKFRRS